MAWYHDRYAEPSDLNGLVVKSIDVFDDEDEVRIETECGRVFVFRHVQDCCERVILEHFDENFKVLENQRLVSVEMDYDGELSEEERDARYIDSYTFTNVRFKTDENTVMMKWFGESNGYYGETISLYEKHNPDCKD